MKLAMRDGTKYAVNPIKRRHTITPVRGGRDYDDSLGNPLTYQMGQDILWLQQVALTLLSEPEDHEVRKQATQDFKEYLCKQPISSLQLNTLLNKLEKQL